jgi:hypothetical protein
VGWNTCLGNKFHHELECTNTLLHIFGYLIRRGLNPASQICLRIDKLVDDAPSLTRNQLKCQYKGIDNGVTHGMLAAERKVRPSKNFKYAWSLELDRLDIVYDTGESTILM